MAICINNNLPEYKNIAEVFEGAVEENYLQGAIALWQQENGINQMPSIAQIKGVLEASGTIIQDNYQPIDYAATFGTDANTNPQFIEEFMELIDPVNLNKIQSEPFSINPNKNQPIEKLDRTLKKWLTTLGVDLKKVRTIYDKDGKPINAVAQTDVMADTIRFVEGKMMEDSLAEEAAHIFVEYAQDTPFGRELLDLAISSDKYVDVKEAYSSIYETELDILKETAGQLIAQEILGIWKENTTPTNEDPITKGKIRSLFDSIIKYLKKLFYTKGIKSYDFVKEVSPFRAAAERILNLNHEGLSKPNYSGKYYQLNANQLDKREQVRDILKSFQVKKDPKDNFYLNKDDLRVLYRVSDFLRNFYKRIYGEKELSDTEDSHFFADKGVVLHTWYEVMLQNIHKKTGLNYAQIKAEVFTKLAKDSMADTRDIATFANVTPIQFRSISTGLQLIYKSIERNQAIINQQNGTNETFDMFFEFLIINKEEDTAGTLDVAVLYSNGKMAIYDYKNINFKSKAGEIFAGVSENKIEDYNARITQYKNILASQGITEFAESRIIPINVQYAYDSKAGQYESDGFKTIELYSEEGVNKDYLEQIPVAQEVTGNVTFDEEVLHKLYLRLENLKKSYNLKPSAVLAENIERTRQIINEIIVKHDFTHAYEEISGLYEAFYSRLLRLSTDPNAIDMTEIFELTRGIATYKNFSAQFRKSMGTGLTNSQLKALTEMETKLNMLFVELQSNVINLLLPYGDTDINLADVSQNYKALGLQFKMMNTVNSPHFRKFTTMLSMAENAALKEIIEAVESFNEYDKELTEWATANGLDKQAAFNRIVDNKTGRLNSIYDPKFNDDAKEARDKRDIDFFLKYYQIERIVENGVISYRYTGKALEYFEKSRKNILSHFGARIDDSQGTLSAKDEVIALRYKKWLKRYDIRNNPDLIFSMSNGYMYRDYNSPHMKDYYSKNYKFLLNKENKALLNYYNEYRRLNETFEEITGRKLGAGFIANIQKDIITKLMENGLTGLAELRDGILSSLSVQEEDDYYMSKETHKNAVDIDGTPLFSVPVHYTHEAIIALTNEEKQNIKAILDLQLSLRQTVPAKDFKAKYDKELQSSKLDTTYAKYIIANDYMVEGSPEYKVALNSIYSSAERAKGYKSKSYDLTTSMILMLQTVYNYKHLAEIEGAANLLLWDLNNGLNAKTALPQVDKNILDQYTGKVASSQGLPKHMISAFESIVLSEIYGKKNQDNLPKIRIFGKEINSYKLIKTFLNWSSKATLGLKPILIARNSIQVGTNAMFVAAEGAYFNGTHVTEATKEIFHDTKRALMIDKFFNIHNEDIIRKMAKKASATRANQYISTDTLFKGLELTDTGSDVLVLLSMIRNYGIDANGKVVRLRHITSGDKRSLYERISIDANNKVTVDGLSDVAYGKFRDIVKNVTTKVKGMTPSSSRLLISNQIVGQALMQYRSWMPGMLRARFEYMNYNPVLESVDIGRYHVFFQDVAKGGLSAANELMSLALGSIPIIGYYLGKNIKANKKAAEVYLKAFNAANPNNKMELNDFIELRMNKLKSLVLELNVISTLYLLSLLAAGLIPKKEEGKPVEKFLTQTLYRVLHGSYLEASFFTTGSSALEIFRSPMAIIGFITNFSLLFSNTLDETRDLLYGQDMKGFYPWDWEKDNRDKSPRFKYTSKLIPGVNGILDLFNTFDTFTMKSR